MMRQVLILLTLLLVNSPTAAVAQKRHFDAEARDAQTCHANENRIHIAREQGSECISYRFFDQKWRETDPVLVILHGDRLPDDLPTPKRVLRV